MKRSKPLRVDPAKTRAFIERGRKTPLKRSVFAGKASPAKRKVAPVEGPLDPSAWKMQVFAASRGMCVVSKSRARDVDDWRFHAHHPVAQQALRKRGLHAWLWDARNGMLVTMEIHMTHEHSGGEYRIAREYLPGAVWEFCAELDALAGTRWATNHVERHHPAAGNGRKADIRR